ncbi:MAG: hypothetical protein EB100_06665 [Crocinitomicaceae bacterium]|jgi:hypothetical protein|nr:hypothetical protein [Crocinitomicaceae bacterium]
MEEKKINRKAQKIQSLINDVQSDSLTKVKAALEALEINGDPTVIPAIIQELTLEGHSEKNMLLLDFLAIIKTPNAIEVFIEVLDDSHFLPYRQLILNAIWNSPLNFSDYLPKFVEIALHGDFMETLECLTIIENLVGPFEEKSIFEAHLLLTTTEIDANDEKKKTLLSEIALKIKEFQQIIDTDTE